MANLNGRISVTQQIEKVAASCWIKPATLEELKKRMGWAEYGTWHMMTAAVRKGWCYWRGETLHTYREAAALLVERGWDVDPDQNRKPELTPLEKEYQEYKKRGGVL